MKIAVHEFTGEKPESHPFTILETWDELDPDVIRRYLIEGLGPNTPLGKLNRALGHYISDGDENGDGWVLTEQGVVGPLRVGICRTDRGHLGRIIVNLEEQ